ncbi:MAG: DUF3141 domain-containing protein [Deltaproteobacteria bacterium]|nr:DUF3141 domain-containing protein [Deltaproteobacteria bacterium]
MTNPTPQPARTVAEASLGPWLDLSRRARTWTDRNVLAPEPVVDWTTPSVVVLDHELLQVREFRREGERFNTRRARARRTPRRPLMLVAPEINGAIITDYGPDQSLVAAALEAGFPRVFVVAWRSADATNADTTVGDAIRAIETAIEHVGGPVHLAGICQGGWEAAMVAARRQDLVASLTVIASAIDFRAGDCALTKVVDATPQPVYEGLVAAGGGAMRGEFLNLGFNMLQFWKRMVVQPLRDWNGLDDEDYLARHALFSRWYDPVRDLPGPLYLRVVDDLFRKNLLVQGEFVLEGDDAPVELGAITCPIAMIAGSKDAISPPPQVFALAEHAASQHQLQRTFDGGHVGVSIGHRVLVERWPEVFAWLRGFDPEE